MLYLREFHEMFLRTFNGYEIMSTLIGGYATWDFTKWRKGYDRISQRQTVNSSKGPRDSTSLPKRSVILAIQY